MLRKPSGGLNFGSLDADFFVQLQKIKFIKSKPNLLLSKGYTKNIKFLRNLTEGEEVKIAMSRRNLES